MRHSWPISHQVHVESGQNYKRIVIKENLSAINLFTICKFIYDNKKKKFFLNHDIFNLKIIIVIKIFENKSFNLVLSQKYWLYVIMNFGNDSINTF